MRFLRDSLVTFLTLGATFLLGMVSSVLTARYLGPEGKGILTLVLLLPALCVSLGSFGLGAANVYLLRRREVRMGTLMGNSFAVALAATILASGVIGIAWPWLGGRVLHGVEPELAVLGLLSLPMLFLTDYLFGLLLGTQRVVRYNAVSISAKVFSVAALALALVVLRAGVTGAIVASVLGSLITVVFLLGALRAAGGKLPAALRVDFGSLRRALGYGGREHVGNIAMFLSYRVDMFFVAALAGTAAVGIYSIAVMMAELFFYLPNAVSTVLFPRLAGRSEWEGARNAAQTARVISAAVGAGVLLSIPLASPAVRLAFSSAFLPAVPAFFGLLPGIYALSISKVLSRYFTGSLGQPLLNARAQGISLAVNLPLNVLLIPRYGILGAAIASSAAYVAHAAVTLFLFHRHSGLPVREALLLRGDDLDWMLGQYRHICFARLGENRA
jgi:O-antigen/teichoic acid export membrane protein